MAVRGGGGHLCAPPLGPHAGRACVGFFLDTPPPRKRLTAFCLECGAVDIRGRACGRGWRARRVTRQMPSGIIPWWVTRRGASCGRCANVPHDMSSPLSNEEADIDAVDRA